MKKDTIRTILAALVIGSVLICGLVIGAAVSYGTFYSIEYAEHNWF